MVTHFKMNLIDWTALALVIVGAINWGLVGVGYFVDSAANWNLLNIVLDSVPELEFAIYALVGLAGLYGVYFGVRVAGVEIQEPEVESTERGTAK